MAFLDSAVSKYAGVLSGVSEQNRTKSENMVGGISGRLTDKGIKNFVNRSAPGSKLADGRGLYLLITQNQTAIWRIKYRIEGKEKVNP